MRFIIKTHFCISTFRFIIILRIELKVNERIIIYLFQFKNCILFDMFRVLHLQSEKNRKL
jgi:hypothetical protein